MKASTGLGDYLDWLYVQRVSKIERRSEFVKKATHRRVYSITSSGMDQANSKRLLEVVQTHWNIEDRLHYRRVEATAEGWCHFRLGHPQR